VLDDKNVLKQRDPKDALAVAAEEWFQIKYEPEIIDRAHDGRELTKVIVAGMGGSALAGLFAKTWLSKQLKVPFEVVREYELPAYVDRQTLVIAISYSGNTEETLGCLQQARERQAQVGILAAGGHLREFAEHQSIAHVVLPDGVPQRMAMFYMLKGLLGLLVNFDLVAGSILKEVANTAEWLQTETATWLPTVTTDKNEAKQLALLAVGKTPIIYGGALTAPVAYKWKISWNENAKNIAFWNEYPEFNHDEFMGWASHPVDKPFVIFDLVSNFEHPQILKRFQLSDRLLSGKRPKSNVVNLKGDTLLKQLLWGCVLADFVSIYVAIINGVDPTPVELIEKLKKELG